MGLSDFAGVACISNGRIVGGRKETAVGESRLKVLYDGQCPFCRLEMRWLSGRDRRGRLAFDDISDPAFDPGRYGLMEQDVMGVIHAVLPDGRTVRGLEVFRLAYRAVGLGWLVAPPGWPILRRVCDGLHALFARYRVALGRAFVRGCPRDVCGVNRDGGAGRSRN